MMTPISEEEITPYTICICGGGSLGTVCAAVFLSQGLRVNILSGHPEKWSGEISAVDPEGKLYSGRLNKVSSNPGEVVPEADMVLLCVPGFIIRKTLTSILPYLRKDSAVGSIVSSTGFFYFAHEILPPDTVLFGFQRVPFIARMKDYGSVGEILGYKPSVNIALENREDLEISRQLLEKIFLTPVTLLDNFYEASLSNSNPILHTGRLYTMWKDYDGKPLPRRPLFYKEWTDEASETLIAMDNEFMTLVRTLGIRPGTITSLLDYYEQADAPSLTRKISSIPAFESIPAPMKSADGGWVPDLDSRYFKEDFPFGLSFIKELAAKHGVKTPTIDRVYAWGCSMIERFS